MAVPWSPALGPAGFTGCPRQSVASVRSVPRMSAADGSMARSMTATVTPLPVLCRWPARGASRRTTSSAARPCPAPTAARCGAATAVGTAAGQRPAAPAPPSGCRQQHEPPSRRSRARGSAGGHVGPVRGSVRAGRRRGRRAGGADRSGVRGRVRCRAAAAVGGRGAALLGLAEVARPAPGAACRSVLVGVIVVAAVRSCRARAARCARASSVAWWVSMALEERAARNSLRSLSTPGDGLA